MKNGLKRDIVRDAWQGSGPARVVQNPGSSAREVTMSMLERKTKMKYENRQQRRWRE